MVGRTPEYLGKKIEAREMKLAMLYVLIFPAVILIPTAIGAVIPAGLSSISNPGPHGFSQILYAYTEAGANNGSAFGGLNANVPFYNVTMAFVMLLGRFMMAIPALAIAGSVAAKKTTAASAGTYPVTFTAANTGGTTTQSFVLTVTGAPAITSAATATATVGSGFSFTVNTTGAPAPALAEAGALPQGLTWTDNHNGTATLAGTPGVGTGGVYKLTVTATNSGGTATQAFTLTVDQAPSVTSAATATATHGTAFTFTFTSAGYPVPNVTHTGTVAGLTYTNNGNGTATLKGTPRTAGTYSLTITAKDSVGTTTQTFTLTVK